MVRIQKTIKYHLFQKKKISSMIQNHVEIRSSNSRKILAIYFDGLPAKRLDLYGGSIPVPNFKKLAERGTLYKNYIVTAPSTAMTMTSMFTGLFPHEFGRYSWSNSDISLPEHVIPLIEILSSEGFEMYFLWDEEFMTRRTQTKYKIINWEEYNINFLDIANKEIQAKQTTDLLTKLSKSNINKWFSFVRFSDTASSKYIGSAKSYSPYSLDDEVIEADAILGKLLEVVDDSVDIIVFSDHGKCYGERGLFKYAFNLAETTLHVPLICSWGNGKVVDDLTSAVEFPNIILQNEIRKHKYLYADTAYAHQWIRNTMIRDGRWKYTYNRIGWPVTEELYDLKYDPSEQINLIGTYKDPYRDSRPKGDTTSNKFSPSGLSLDGKDVSEVYPRNDWDQIRKKIKELRNERERIWLLQGVDERNYG